MPPIKTQYISIDESQGGTFPMTAAKPYIGTNRLITCVGVYIPISDSRCFLAHINAYVEKPGSIAYGHRLVTAEQGAEIKDRVLTGLREHSRREEWSMQDVDECLKDGKRKIVLMCPNFNRPEKGKELSGKYVIEVSGTFRGKRSLLLSLRSISAMKANRGLW